MIVIIGASGAVGIPAIGALLARGERLRALSSSEASAARLRELGVAEVVVGDYRVDADVATVVDGADQVLYIPARFIADEAEIGRRVVDAAKAADVGHLLFCSAFHPQLRELGHHWQKLEVEAHLIASDLRATVVQPSMFMQNLRIEWPRVVAEGVYSRPYSPDSPMSVVDTDDLGEAIARIMTEPSLQGATYELCGPGPITHNEMAELISEALGQPVAAVVRDIDDWRAWATERGWTEYAMENYVAMCRHYDEHGFKYGTELVLSAILGRKPTDYRTFIANFVAAQQGGD